MNPHPFVNGWLEIWRESFEGGRPGQGTGYLDGTAADGSGNHGLLATLDALSAAEASDPTVLGISVASQAAHLATHIEAGIRYVQGDRSKVDWAASFQPATVDEAAWEATRARVRAAYDSLIALARGFNDWDEQSAGGMAAFLAHAAYHLGAIRQIVKLVKVEKLDE